MSNSVKDINIDGELIEVDSNCADMVLFFNKIGLRTRMCCEGHEKPIFRIWFDVDDEIMLDFIKKVAMWTEVFVKATNKERTKFETNRVIRGLQGWVLKRTWYPLGEYREEWIYQVEGSTHRDKIIRANKDLATMRLIYFGSEDDIKEVQALQEEIARKKIRELEGRLEKVES